MSTCKACNEALVFRPDEATDDFEGQAGENNGLVVPDDLKLGCGCHYHW